MRNGTIPKILILTALVVFLIAVFLWFNCALALNISPFFLKEPEISRREFSGPLYLSTLEKNVLGYQKIDPQDIVKFVNIERQKRGAQALKIDPVLTKAAKMRAEVILKYQNFSHQDPYEGIELVTVLHKSGYSYRWASENIGMGGVSAQDFVFGFMNSKSHRENLLNPHLQETGVAVVTGPYKQYYVNIAVQMFAIPTSYEKYLGYSKEDVERYSRYLSDINYRLYQTNQHLLKDKSDDNYLRALKIFLERQRQILSIIHTRMLKEEPLFASHADLIDEYNKNWDKLPRKSNQIRESFRLL